VLRIRHERNRHDLAIDADQLAFLKILPPFGDIFIQRPDQPVVHQRDDRIGGDDGDRVGGRVRGQCRHLNVLVFLGRVVGDFDGGAGTAFGLLFDRAPPAAAISARLATVIFMLRFIVGLLPLKSIAQSTARSAARAFDSELAPGRLWGAGSA
jgi:hypothetical protein